MSGVGVPVSFQKTRYSPEDLELLSKLITWWILLEDECEESFRDKRTVQALINTLVRFPLKGNKHLVIYSVFCPSYKKGMGEVGYTGILGERSKKVIQKFVDFVYKSNEIGLETLGLALFSDLLLENFDMLQDTSYKIDLCANYTQFSNLFSKLDTRNLIEVKESSEIPEFRKGIGERGITSGEVGVSEEVFDLVNKRNRVFYADTFGWNNTQIEERTKLLARCYAYMGGYFRKMLPNGVMYWSESAYERGMLYHGLKQDSPIPIVYPKKDEVQ